MTDCVTHHYFLLLLFNSVLNHRYLHYRDTLNTLVRRMYNSGTKLEMEQMHAFHCPYTAAQVFAARYVQ